MGLSVTKKMVSVAAYTYQFMRTIIAKQMKKAVTYSK